MLKFLAVQLIWLISCASASSDACRRGLDGLSLLQVELGLAPSEGAGAGASASLSAEAEKPEEKPEPISLARDTQTHSSHSAGHAFLHAVGSVGHGVAHGVGVTVSTVAHGVMYAVTGVAHGIGYTVSKTAHGVGFCVVKTAHGVGYVVVKTSQGVEYCVVKTAQGVEYMVVKTAQGVGYVVVRTAHGFELLAMTGVHATERFLALKTEGYVPGQGEVLVSALVTNSLAIIGVLGVFSVLRQRYPLVYSGRSPEQPFLGTALHSWVWDTWALTTEEVKKASNLDHAMLIQFSKLCMTILAVIGVPMVLVLCPMHAALGSGEGGLDKLSIFGLANVHSGSWLCYVHAVVVWVVVSVSMFLVYSAQESFLPHRFEWLRNQPSLQARTVLVKAIPPQYRSDDALRGFFSTIFSKERVESVHLVKQTQKLVPLLHDLDKRQATLKLVKHQWDMQGSPMDDRPMHYLEESHRSKPRCKKNHMLVEDDRDLAECSGCAAKGTIWHCSGSCPYNLCAKCAEINHTHRVGDKIDALNYYDETIKECKAQVTKERARVQEASSCTNSALNTSSAFVSFSSRSDVNLALQVQYLQDAGKMVACEVPEPNDIIFSDLQVSEDKVMINKVAGWVLVACVFCGFLPIVISIYFISKDRLLASAFSFVGRTSMHPMLHFVCERWFAVTAILDGLIAPLVLVMLMDVLPTVLNLIFHSWFNVKSSSWAQMRMQNTYFWFLLTFTMSLMFALDGSLLKAFRSIIDVLPRIFAVLENAASVPEASQRLPTLLSHAFPASAHFYMKYLALQWVTHALGMLRVVQLWKFVTLRALWGDEKAKAMSEPENQDYCGIGARSARLAIDMVIVMMFSSLSPLIMVIGFADFGLRTLIFEYMFVFAETRKSDMGGVFWVRQLEHLMYGLLIYTVLQVGCLAQRSNSMVAPILATPALGIWLLFFERFKQLRWESLPLEDCADDKVTVVALPAPKAKAPATATATGYRPWKVSPPSPSPVAASAPVSAFFIGDDDDDDDEEKDKANSLSYQQPELGGATIEDALERVRESGTVLARMAEARLLAKAGY